MWLLTFTTLWAISADNKLMIFFLFFPENRFRDFMQIVWRQFAWNLPRKQVLTRKQVLRLHANWRQFACNLKTCFPGWFHANCLQTICMKSRNLFSGKNKKNIINLLSAEIAQRVVKVNNHIDLGKALFNLKLKNWSQQQQMTSKTFLFHFSKKKTTAWYLPDFP